MTTIAYRSGIMAADSQSAYGDWKVPGATQKLHKLSNGCIAGTTGSEAICRRTMDWIEAGRAGDQPQPAADKGGCVIMMHPSGKVEVFEDGATYVERAPFMAYGSGQPAALAALHMGATAKKAVAIAMLVDKSSGGAIRTMSVGKTQRSKA